MERLIMTGKTSEAYFKCDNFEISKVEERIFCLRPSEGVELDVEDALKMRPIFNELSAGAKYGVQIDATNFFSITQEMRKLTSSKEYCAYRYATVFVTRLLANRIVGNFFLSFHKPSSPTRIFTREKHALNWIRSQRG